MEQERAAPAGDAPRPANAGSAPAAVAVDHVSVSYGAALAAVDDVSLDIEPGSIVALLGPSGCGKTSLLRAIAGLERPSTGTVSIAGRSVSSPSSWIKPERRKVGMVFQDGALFPHLTVDQNIAFGLRAPSSTVPPNERGRRVDDLLDLVGLTEFRDRLPHTLSGGQQQRVALARSLAPNPAVLLLDEPFSALDTGMRVQLRAEVARILRSIGVTSIFVTHDQDEAFVLGDRVAVMREGRIEQYATPAELYRAPANPWVAQFVGEANLVTGHPTNDPGRVATALGSISVEASLAQPSGAGVAVLVRPEQVGVGDGDDAEIIDVEYYGHDVRYELLLHDGTRLSARTHPEQLRNRGDRVSVSLQDTMTTIAFAID